MINISKQINNIYKEWSNDNYIYEKDKSNIFKPITYKDFIEKTLSISKYLIDNGYKDKTIILLSENSINLLACDLAITLYVGRSSIICKEWNKQDI